MATVKPTINQKIVANLLASKMSINTAFMNIPDSAPNTPARNTALKLLVFFLMITTAFLNLSESLAKIKKKDKKPKIPGSPSRRK